MITSDRLAYEGQTHVLSLPGGDGRSIRSLATPMPVPVPIYVAPLGPANLTLTGASADGLIDVRFFPEHANGPIDDGAAAAGRSLRELDLVAAASVAFTDDAKGARRRHSDEHVDRLEQRGHIVQRANPADRRSSIIELIPDGRDVLETTSSAFDEELEKFLGARASAGALERFDSAPATPRAASAEDNR